MPNTSPHILIDGGKPFMHYLINCAVKLHSFTASNPLKITFILISKDRTLTLMVIHILDTSQFPCQHCTNSTRLLKIDAVFHQITGRPNHPVMISISIGLLPNPIAATHNVPNFMNLLFQHTDRTQRSSPSKHQFSNLKSLH